MKANFHTHTIFCDGLNSAEDCVLAAINKKMRAIGFSTHAPIPIASKWNMPALKTQNYFAEIQRLKKKYADQIEIYAGFEMDYLITADKNLIHKYINQADYTIGSVHYLYAMNHKKYYAIDGTASDVAIAYQEFTNGDNKFLVRSYYNELLHIIREFRPNIIGHLDVIKKRNHQNRYFDETEKWYIDLVTQVLTEIAAQGIIVEVNTGGRLRGYIADNYPSAWILKECLAKKIPIIISSDAHQAEDIDGFFTETAEQLKNLGFTHQKTLRAEKWADVVL